MLQLRLLTRSFLSNSLCFRCISNTARSSSKPFNATVKYPRIDNFTIVIHYDPNDRSKEKEFVCYEEPHMIPVKKGAPGFYPNELGSKLDDGKYETVMKLGYGQHSSSWLAKAVGYVFQQSRQYHMRLTRRREDHHVAVKVISAEWTSEPQGDSLPEAETMKRIAAGSADHPGRQHVSEPLGSFIAESKQGSHQCLVYKPLAIDLQWLLCHEPFRGGLPLQAVKRVIKQNLLALDYLHRECQIVHTGESDNYCLLERPTSLDINYTNMMVDFKYGPKEIEQYLASVPSLTYEPQIEPFLSDEPIITARTLPMPFPDLETTDMENLDIRLADYSHGTPLSLSNLHSDTDG